MQYFSLAPLTVNLQLSPSEMVECAANAGYSHVDIRLIPASDNEPTWDMLHKSPELVATGRALVLHKMQVGNVEILRLKPETKPTDFEAFFEAAVFLTAKHVLMAGNDPDFNRMLDNYTASLELAAKYDLTLDLEPMPWTNIPNVKTAARLINGADKPNAGYIHDPIHFDRGGSSLEDIKLIDPQYIRYTQLCDAHAEKPTTLEGLLYQARGERQYPGEGALDLKAHLNALPKGILISIECPNLPRAAKETPLTLAKYALECAKRLVK
jgi:sugar phosphate isomerase/epimerase